MNDQAVVFVGKYCNRLEGFGLFRGHIGIRNDNHDVAHLHQTGRGAVQTNNAGSTFSPNYIGFQTGAVVIVHNLNLFPFYQVGGFLATSYKRDKAQDFIRRVRLSFEFSDVMKCVA